MANLKRESKFEIFFCAGSCVNLFIITQAMFQITLREQSHPQTIHAVLLRLQQLNAYLIGEFMKELLESSSSQKQYINRMARIYGELEELPAKLSESMIDETTLDLILSLPSPRKEKELVHYFLMVARPTCLKAA